MALTDAALIAASQDDPELFAGLFDRHYAAIAGFLRRRLERSLADELAAETFLRAFDARGRYDTTHANARPWLFGIAVKVLSRQRRQEKRLLRALARVGEPADAPDELSDVHGRVDAGAISQPLAAAIASLAVHDREVLLLYAWAELSYEQISAALDIPVGTVRSRLHRARAKVRKTLARHPPAPPLAAQTTAEEPHEQRT
jgi:RNA polymerase sigma factor (sigma-70 family)